MADESGFAIDQPITKQSICCVVGAGPAGVVMAWLLARAGIAVTLLERHEHFERDFRGDTLHPGVLEILDQMGLAEQVLALPHTRMASLSFHSPGGSLAIANLRRLRTKFPFVAMLPQSRFLEFMVGDASRFPTFRVIRGAEVSELIEANGAIRGVRYRDTSHRRHEIHSDLTIAADGRSSKLRRLAVMDSISSSPAIDILWFRIPRFPQQTGGGYFGPGGYMIVLERQDQWQVGYVIPKGKYLELRSAGFEAFRQSVCRLAPAFTPSLACLTDWRDIKFLAVQADRLRNWHRPGLLFLGDAAHVMSPAGGVGINYAIQDAVVAANVLTEPLQSGTSTMNHLRLVQRHREWPTRIAQALQAFDQRFLIEPALRDGGEYRLPWWLRLTMSLPLIRDLPSRLFAFGVRRVRVRRQRN